jgi:Tfp pilus assembly protein PilO
MKELSKREKIIVAFVGAAAVVFLVQRLIIQPQSKRLTKTRAELASISEQYAGLVPKLAGFRTLSSELVMKERQLAELEQALSHRAEPAEIIHKLSQEVRIHGLQLQQLRPQQTRVIRTQGGKAGEFRQLVLNLGVRGRYQQLGNFINGLEQQPFYVQIRKIRVAQGEGRGALLNIDIELLAVARS